MSIRVYADGAEPLPETHLDPMKPAAGQMPVRITVHGSSRRYTAGLEQPVGAAERGMKFQPRQASGYANGMAQMDDLVTVNGVQMTLRQAHANHLLDDLE